MSPPTDDPADGPASWRELFERADAVETSEEAIREALAARRDRSGDARGGR